MPHERDADEVDPNNPVTEDDVRGLDEDEFDEAAEEDEDELDEDELEADKE
jgi:hypothetical protein